MSVFKPPKARYWRYDFRTGGYRFHGSTEETTKRAAQEVEKRKREEAKQEVSRLKAMKNGPMTLDVAAGRYWLEVGQHHKASALTWRALEWLLKELGGNTYLTDITDDKVALMVAKRRGTKRVTRKKDGTVIERMPKPATVNRLATEPLRKIMNRARDIWQVPVPAIQWRKHLLAEPKERVRELSEDEEARIFAALRPEARPLFVFSLATGLRRKEALGLRWQDIDWNAGTIRIIGKGGDIEQIVLSQEARAVLSPLRGDHPEYVFTYAAIRADPARKIERGQRIPISQEWLKTIWRRALNRAGVSDYRWHDNRHTRATRLLRQTGNLRLVQRLLRHSDIKTTTKYAHVTDDDLRTALDTEYQRKSLKLSKDVG